MNYYWPPGADLGDLEGGVMGWWRRRRQRKALAAEQQYVTNETLRLHAEAMLMLARSLDRRNDIPVTVQHGIDINLMARDVRATMIDVRAGIEVMARALEPMIPDDMLPPDRLEVRVASRNGEE